MPSGGQEGVRRGGVEIGSAEIGARAVVDEGVAGLFPVRALGEVGIVGDQPIFARLVRLYRRLADDLDYVGEQGILDDAVHRFGDIVDADEGELFEDGVAFARGDALIPRVRLVHAVDSPFGIAELVEDIVGLVTLGGVDEDIGVGCHPDSVAEHHGVERRGDVGDGDIREALESGGRGAFHDSLLIALRVRVFGGVVEGVAAVLEHIRAVCRGRVLVEHDIRGVLESDRVEGVAELAYLSVFEGAEDLCAVVRDVDDLAEFQRSDLVRDIVERPLCPR